MADSLDIRGLRAEDIPSALALLKGFHYAAKLARWAPWEESNQGWGMYLARCLQEQNLKCFVAVCEKQVVGLISGALHSAFWNPSVVLCSEQVWWVHPEHRGKKVGTALMKVFEAWGEEMGAGSITAGSSKGLGHKETGHVLRKNGFELEEKLYMKGVG